MDAHELADFISISASHAANSRARTADMLRYLADEMAGIKHQNYMLKAFAKAILYERNDDFISCWDGDELQDLAVKTGLLNAVQMTEPCNTGKEESQECICSEYCYGDKSWNCYRVVNFLLEENE